MDKKSIGIIAAALLVLGSVRAANATIIADGISSATNLNWVSRGLATLGGVTSGVDWTVSGEAQGTDWQYGGSGGQGNLGASPLIEWPSAGNGSPFGFTDGNQIMSELSGMITHLGGNQLLISEAAPFVGAYTVSNGTSSATVTATTVGQVLQFIDTAPSAGSTLTFTSTALDSNANLVGGGPVGFSSVPEPSTLVLSALGLIGLAAAVRARRRG